MGIYTDLLNNAVAWDAGGHDGLSHGTDRVITMQIKKLCSKQGDIDYPNGYAAIDEVQEIGTYNGSVTGGNFTLTLNLGVDGSINFTTANIVYNANSSTIESAIDTAASGIVPGWTNGDISVSGGDLTTNAVSLLYDGASVDNTNHQLVQINNIDLSGGGTVGTVSTIYNGQTNRTAMAVLNSLGLVSSPPPPQGTIIGLSASFVRGVNPYVPSQQTLQALAKQASIEDGSEELYTELMKIFNLSGLL